MHDNAATSGTRRGVARSTTRSASGRLRVLHVVPSLQGGGAERVLLTLLGGLTDLSHMLAVTEDGPLRPLVPPAVPVRIAATERSLARLMKSYRPEVVHTWLDDSLIMAALPAAGLGIALVHRIYNTPSAHRAWEPGGPGYTDTLSHALRGASRVVALSATAADDAAAFYRIDRPHVIYNGLPLAGRRGMGATAIPKAPGRFVILNVGRLEPQKGQTYLIEAFARIACRHPHVDVWIAGRGQLERELKTQAADAGIADRVKFVGFHEDVAALHAAADVFAFPSMFEGFGNALAEALLAGLPVIASDLDVIRNDVTGGRPAAVLCPPGDAGALADALDRLIGDASARALLGRAAREAGARFSRAHMLDEYRRLYADLARSGESDEGALSVAARSATPLRPGWRAAAGSAA